MKGLASSLRASACSASFLLLAAFAARCSPTPSPAAAPAVSPPSTCCWSPTRRGRRRARRSGRPRGGALRSFSLVEAAGDDDAAPARRRRAAPRRHARGHHRRAASFDPAADRPRWPASGRPTATRCSRWSSSSGRRRTPGSSACAPPGRGSSPTRRENAYVVHASGDAVERVAGLVGTDPAVRAVVPLGAADKVEGRAGGAARYGVSTRGRTARRAPTPGRRRWRQRQSAAATQSSSCRRPRSTSSRGDPAVVAIERDAPPKPDRRARRQIVAGNLNAFLAAERARLPGLARRRASRHAASTFDDRRHRLRPRRRHDPAPDFLDGVVLTPAGSPTSRTTRATRTRATAPATAPTSRRSPRATTPGPAPRTRTAPASTTGSAWRRSAEIGRLEDLQAATATRRSFSARPTIARSERLRAGPTRASRTTPGARGRLGWGPTRARSAVRPARARRPVGHRGNQQMVEVFAAGNDGDAIPARERGLRLDRGGGHRRRT